MKRSRILTHPSLAVLVAAGLVAAATPAGADLLKKPSQIRHLTTAMIAQGDTGDLLEVGPTGGLLGTYTVPRKHVLIVTTVTILPVFPGSGVLETQLFRGPSGLQNSESWKVPMDRPTQLQFPNGLVFSPDEFFRVQNTGASDLPVVVELSGYEARDK